MILDSQNGTLKSRDAIKTDEHVTTVFAVSGGYPEKYNKGEIINIATDCDTVFHAGTKRVDNGLITNGGRVLAATSCGDTMEDALESSYELLTKISFDNMVYRKDIGQDLINY
jgi:phosphoribosylamine--glycine ligase